MVEDRVKRSIKTYDSFPDASIEFRLLNVFIDKFEWADGLTKEELSKIVYGSELRQKELHMSQAKTRISSIVANLRKKYFKLLIYSTPHINPKTSKKEWRLFCNWEKEDIKNILKMLQKIVNSMEKTIAKVNYEESKSMEIKKLEYEKLIKILKKESDKKRKKKK